MEEIRLMMMLMMMFFCLSSLHNRTLVVAPRDVYAIQFNNKLSAAVNASVVFTKHQGDTEIKNAEILAGESWKTGPFDYKEGSATFRYVVKSVEVKRASDTASLAAPFDHIEGVTPLLLVDINPPVGDDGDGDDDSERIGSLETSTPNAKTVSPP